LSIVPRDAEPDSSAQLEDPLSATDTFKGVDDVRPNVRPAAARRLLDFAANIPRYFLSGSDIVIRLSDLRSIPSFQFYLVSYSAARPV